MQDSYDVVSVEGFVLIENLVDGHSIGEILEEDLNRNAGPSEYPTTAKNFRIAGDQIFQSKIRLRVVRHVDARTLRPQDTVFVAESKSPSVPG